MDTKLPEGITPEMIDDAKQKYGKERVFLAELFASENPNEILLSILILKPSAMVRDQFLKFVDTNMSKAEDILLKACVASSKEAVMADEVLRSAAIHAITNIIPSGRASVKNV